MMLIFGNFFSRDKFFREILEFDDDVACAQN